MREIVRTNNIVLVTAIEALLNDVGIGCAVFDQNMSVLEGSAGVIPRRIMVTDEDETPARRLLTDAGLGEELRPLKP